MLQESRLFSRAALTSGATCLVTIVCVGVCACVHVRHLRSSLFSKGMSTPSRVPTLPGKPGKNHGILQKIIKIMEKLHETWKKYFSDGKKWLATVMIISII